jgi:predicted acetyltransferase
MATTMGVFPFTVRLNGAPVKMGGVTAVGTLPQFRRRGLLRQVMKQGFETMRERGQAYAILWASMGAIYQRFGYGLAASQMGYSFDPRYAAFESPSAAPGSVTLLSSEDGFPVAKQLYIQHVAARNLAIHRSTVLWRVDNLRPAKKGGVVHIAVYRNADGEARGHLAYEATEDPDIRPPGPNQLFEVKDFVALDMDAYRGLWDYIRRHDLVGRVRIQNWLPVDDPAPDLLLEPRVLNRHTSDAIWMRIVDVEAAVPQRPYGDRGELTFAIAGDDMCPSNNGTYLLETDGPTTAIRRTDRAAGLTMRVNSLATLLAGHRSATHLARAGLIEASDAATLGTADRLFRTEYAPHCPNHF